MRQDATEAYMLEPGDTVMVRAVSDPDYGKVGRILRMFYGPRHVLVEVELRRSVVKPLRLFRCQSLERLMAESRSAVGMARVGAAAAQREG